MARRPLSFTAYRALSRRSLPPPVRTELSRPEGELVWFHVPSQEDRSAIEDLADRLVQLRHDLSVLITQPDAEEKRLRAGIYSAPEPDEHPDAVRGFLKHWAPDTAIWVYGDLRANLLDETARRKIPLHLVAASAEGFVGWRERWVPDMLRHLLQGFDTASVRDVATANRIAELGMERSRISVLPELRETGRVLPCSLADVDDFSAHLSGRPAWLAATATQEEWPRILAAHRQILQNAHRLLLILNPSDPELLPELCQLVSEFDLTFTVWGDGDWPQDGTQVLIADIPDELGLWYRIATITLMGGSLSPGARSEDPMSAAALGTAILYGPHARAHLRSYRRLANAGAARIVNDASSITAAVTRLIAPEQAAAMAHAGWDVVTEGAQVVDTVVNLVQDSLDDRAVALARAKT